MLTEFLDNFNQLIANYLKWDLLAQYWNKLQTSFTVLEREQIAYENETMKNLFLI